MSNNMQVPLNAESSSIEAVVIRCTCGNPASHAGQVCPQGLAKHLGVIAYFNRNPLRQMAWDVFNFFRSIYRSK